MSGLIKDSWVSDLLLHLICYNALLWLKDTKKCDLTQTELSLGIFRRLDPGPPLPSGKLKALMQMAQPAHVPSGASHHL